MKAIAVLLVIALAHVCFAAQAAEKPYLVVSKQIVTLTPTANNDMIVSVRIFNVGDGDAYNVEVSDAGWPSTNFTLTTGATSATWDVLPAGANTTLTYVLKPLKAGTYYLEPAVVSYRVSPKTAQTVTAYSSHTGILRVVRPNEVSRLSVPHYREWGVFVILAFASVALPLVVYAYIRMNYEKGVPKSMVSGKVKKS